MEYINLREQFEGIVETNDRQKLCEFLDDQNISDVAELVNDHPDDEAMVISCMSIHQAARVFKILELDSQKRIIKELPPQKTAALLNELPPDDRTDFFEELPSNAVRELIKLLNADERKIALSLLGYPENSVGRLMTPDYVWVYEDDTAAEVLETIRRKGKNSETIDVIYVINKDGELIDDIRIREFLLAPPEMKVSEIMDGRFIALNAYDDQEKASEVFKMNNRVALPVVSNSNKLLGIVTIDDMLWVAEEEFSEDIQKIGGTVALEQPYLDTPFFRLIQKRVGWLIILFLSELLTATAMAYFNDEIAKATMLAMFIPLIMSSGGNSGSQASTLIIQAMAVGDVHISDWWRVMRREILSGLLLGTILGLIGFTRITLWHELMSHGVIRDLYGPNWLLVAFTVGVSLIGVVM